MRPEGREGAAAALTVEQHYTDAPPGNLEKLLEQAIVTGLTPHIHAIGDKGNRIILDVYEKLLTKHQLTDRDHRWRVIHAQVVHPADVPRIGRLKLVAEVNPYHVSDDMRWMEERIGPERLTGAYAFRKLKDSGAVLIFGSDSPGTNAARYFLNPVYGLYAAVTRQTLKGEPAAGWYPDQRLTIEEAIEAYTKGPAWASFEEDRKGIAEARHARRRGRVRSQPGRGRPVAASRSAHREGALHDRRRPGGVRGELNPKTVACHGRTGAEIAEISRDFYGSPRPTSGKSLTTRLTPSTSVLAPKLIRRPRGHPAISRYVCSCRRSVSVVLATALTSTTTHSSTTKSAK